MSVGPNDLFNLGAPSATLGISVTTPLSAEATFGFINYKATDNGSSLNGTFTLDTSGNAPFQGSTAIHVALQSNLSSAVLPSISAQLDAGWTFNGANGAVDPANPQSFGALPSITLSNVTYDFGRYLDNFLAPLMQQINDVLTPIRPALEVLDTDLPFLKAAMGDNWKSLDTSGALNAQGQNTGDGKLSLLDFLAEPSGGDPANAPAIVKLVDVLNTINNFAQEFGGRTGSPSTPFDLGSFSVPGDVRNAALNLASEVPSLISGTSQNLNTFLAGLNVTYPTLDNNTGKTEGGDISDLINNAEFSFPLLQNPVLAAEILLGGNAELFTLNVLPTFIGVGSFNTDGSAKSTVPIVTVPIEIPPIPISVTPELSAAFGATVGLDFGYDTKGLQDYRNGGFADASQIFNGFYIKNPGNNQPIVNVQAALQADVAISAPFVTIDPVGGIDGSVTVSLKNSGKVYLAPFLPTLQSDPGLLLNLSGQLGGYYGVKISIAGEDFSIITPNMTLVSFGASSGSSGGAIRQSATWAYPGLFGEWGYAGNWIIPSGTTIGATSADFYGDVTIQADTRVQYRDADDMFLTSLSLGSGGYLELDNHVMTIDGRPSSWANKGQAYGSVNQGTIVVTDAVNGGNQITGAATLYFDADFNNTGALLLGVPGSTQIDPQPTIVVEEALSLEGGRHVVTYGNAVWMATNVNSPLNAEGAGAAELWNTDNTVSGAGEFLIEVVNLGTFTADAADPKTFYSYCVIFL